MEINWPSILGASATVAAFFSGVGVGVLSLFIDSKINKAERRILDAFDRKFAVRDTIDAEFRHVHKRLDKIDK